MGEGLAGGHVAPGPLAEQLLHVGLHRSSAQRKRGRPERVEPLAVVAADAGRATPQIGEGMTVGGQAHVDATERAHPLQGREEGRQRVFEVGRARDVGRDGGQHVVARQQHALGRIPQAQVVGRVARRVHCEPVPPGQSHGVAVGDPDGRLRHPEAGQAAGGAGLDGEPDGLVGRRLARRPPGGAAPVRQLRLPHLDQRVGVQFQQLQVDVGVCVVGRGAGRERSVGQQFGAGLLPQLVAAAVVVGVGVGDDGGVHPPDGNAGLPEPVAQRGPRLVPGQSWIDQRRTVGVDQGVAVHVAEAGHAYGQLHPQHPRRHLGHLRGCGLLLLLGVRRAGHRSSWGRVPMNPARRYQRSSSRLSVMSSRARWPPALAGAPSYTDGRQRRASSFTVDTSIDR